MAEPVHDGRDVNRRNMDTYYSHLFPTDLMFNWLSYGSTDPKQCAKREYNITVASKDNPDGIFIRYNSCNTSENLKNLLRRPSPEEWVAKFDIGPIYNGDVSRHKETKLEPEEKELVFDIDMDAYNDTRTCCNDKSVCVYCFKFLVASVKVINRALREDFGFQHLLFVFSGRRGIHCWVSDQRARRLNNHGREALASYLSLETAQRDSQGLITKNALRHPVLARAYDLLKDDFPTLFEKQQIFDSFSKRNALIEKYFVEGGKLRGYSSPLSSTDREHWADLCAYAEAKGDTTGIERIVLHYLYPRLDIEVSKQMNHLLKAPFCIHPKTGRVCVPLDPETIDDFDPNSVPTLGQLMTEFMPSLVKQNVKSEFDTDAYSAVFKLSYLEKVKRTSLLPQYIKFFNEFVKTLVRSERANRSNIMTEDTF